MIDTPEVVKLQRSIQHGDTHTFVKAGPGTGKSTHAARAMNSFDTNVLPLTMYTSWCAAPIREMISRIPGSVYTKGPHGTCLGALYKQFNPPSSNYVVEKKYEFILRDILPEYVTEYKEKMEWSSALCKLWDFARMTMTNWTRPEQLRRIAQQMMLDCPFTYEQASEILVQLAERGKKEVRYRVDFIDMLWLAYMFKLQPPRSFEHVFIDEYQDFTPLTEAVVLQMAGNARVHIFGDNKQAIYWFLGSDGNTGERLSAILGATKRGVEKLELNTTYRCPVLNCEWAQEIDPKIRPAPNAVKGEINHTSLNKILRHDPPQPGDIAISRRRKPGVALIYRLIALGIDATMPGRHIGRGMSALAMRVCKSDRDFNVSFLSNLSKYIEGKVKRLATEEGNEWTIAALQDQEESLRITYHAAEEHNIMNLKAFTQFLESKYSDEDEDHSNKVKVTTIHGVKGSEANRILVLDCESVRDPRAVTEIQKTQEENADYIMRTRSKRRTDLIRNFSEVECVM